jgi:hypothetical protein
MRPPKPLLYFALAALLPFLGTVNAQQRPQTIDDLFNPRPTAPVPQDPPAQQQPRPGDIQREDLPPPGAKEAKQKAKKKREDAAQQQPEFQGERSFKDIMGPPKGGERETARGKSKVLPEVPVPQQQEVKVENPTAVFSGLDKITGRIYPFEVAIKETVQFGALRVTPQACYTRPPTEQQNTTGFVEVDELTLEGKIRRVFTGWMFATSPGLNAVEHPIYDVWLVDCKQGPPDVAKSG